MADLIVYEFNKISKGDKNPKKSKSIANIIDSEFFEEDRGTRFFITFDDPELKKVKKCLYEARNYEEACYILAKINFLRHFSIFNFNFLRSRSRLQKKKKKPEKK